MYALDEPDRCLEVAIYEDYIRARRRLPEALGRRRPPEAAHDEAAVVAYGQPVVAKGLLSWVRPEMLILRGLQAAGRCVCVAAGPFQCREVVIHERLLPAIVEVRWHERMNEMHGNVGHAHPHPGRREIDQNRLVHRIGGAAAAGGTTRGDGAATVAVAAATAATT